MGVFDAWPPGAGQLVWFSLAWFSFFWGKVSYVFVFKFLSVFKFLWVGWILSTFCFQCLLVFFLGLSKMTERNSKLTLGLPG